MLFVSKARREMDETLYSSYEYFPYAKFSYKMDSFWQQLFQSWLSYEPTRIKKNKFTHQYKH